MASFSMWLINYTAEYIHMLCDGTNENGVSGDNAQNQAKYWRPGLVSCMTILYTLHNH